MIRPITFWTVLTLLMAATAFAFAPVEPSPLATPSTWCDQGGVWRQDENRVYDTRDGRLESAHFLGEGPYAGAPESAARDFLLKHTDWVGLTPTPNNLKMVRVQESPMGVHVTFERVIDGVPVYPGNLVVTLDKQQLAQVYFSSLYTFAERPDTRPALSATQAATLARDYLHASGKAMAEWDPDLVIWAGDHRDYALCWRYRSEWSDPRGDWEVLVDAQSGAIRRALDRRVAANGTTYIFDPDPLTTAGAVFYGDPGYVDNQDANSTQLHAQRQTRTLRDIQDTYISGSHIYQLAGPYVTISDREAPTIAPIVQVNNLVYNYVRSQNAFEDCIVYFHIDQSQRWIQSLGFMNIQNAALPVDPHGANDECNAYYHPGANWIGYGDGGSDNVDAAEDAEIILHEYGHAINFGIVAGWGGGDEGAMGEGWGDYWGGSYGRSVSATTHAGWVGEWGLHPCFGGRTLQSNLHYPENAGQEVHYSGRIWSQALYEAELNCNDRTVMNRLGLQHQYVLGTSASMVTAALAVLNADASLYGGIHIGPIGDAFVARGLISRPAGDTCPGIAISSLPYTYGGATSLAVSDYAGCAGTTSRDVLFALTLPTCQNVTASLCGSGYDTGLEVRAGGTCPGATVIACSDDACGSQSTVSFVAQGGITYYLIVHGYNEHFGSYTLNVTNTGPFTAPNDQCPGTAIAALPYTDLGSTRCGTMNYTHCVNGTNPELVYSYTATACLWMTATLCGSGYDTGLEVRTGGSCPGSTLVQCNDDADCDGAYSNFSTLSFAVETGQTYYLLVEGYLAAAGGYQLNVSGVPYAPPGDACPGSGISALPYTVSGSTRCAAPNFEHQLQSTSPDVVYALTLGSCQTVTASLCGSGFDTGLDVRTGGACPGASVITYDDDACASYGPSQVTFTANAGQTYYLVIYGYGTGTGLYSLNVTGTPYTAPNDQCPGTVIPALPYTATGSTRCAVNNYNWGCGASSAASGDVVYSLLLSSCQIVTASLCGSSYNSHITIADDSCDAYYGMACAGEGLCDGAASTNGTVSFRAVAGVTYWLRINGDNGASGTYVLNVTGVPDTAIFYDQCEDWESHSVPFWQNDYTQCAADDYNVSVATGGDGPDLVYKFTLPWDYQVTASLCGSTYDTAIEIRRNFHCPGRTVVASNDNAPCDGVPSLTSTVTFPAEANITYYIIIDGSHGGSGYFHLAVSGQLLTHPDSLVADVVGSSLRLTWAAIPGATYYRVYRAATPDVPQISGNIVGSSSTNTFTDLNALTQSAERRFYAVTVDIPGAAASVAAPAETVALPSPPADGHVSDEVRYLPLAPELASTPVRKGDPAPRLAPDVTPPAAETPPAPPKTTLALPPLFLPAYNDTSARFVPNPAKAAQ